MQPLRLLFSSLSTSPFVTTSCLSERIQVCSGVCKFLIPFWQFLLVKFSASPRRELRRSHLLDHTEDAEYRKCILLGLASGGIDQPPPPKYATYMFRTEDFGEGVCWGKTVLEGVQDQYARIRGTVVLPPLSRSVCSWFDWFALCQTVPPVNVSSFFLAVCSPHEGRQASNVHLKRRWTRKKQSLKQRETRPGETSFQKSRHQPPTHSAKALHSLPT